MTDGVVWDIQVAESSWPVSVNLKLIHIVKQFLWRLYNVPGIKTNAGDTSVYIQTLCLFSRNLQSDGGDGK